MINNCIASVTIENTEHRCSITQPNHGGSHIKVDNVGKTFAMWFQDVTPPIPDVVLRIAKTNQTLGHNMTSQNSYYDGILAFKKYMRDRFPCNAPYDWADLSAHERKEWANTEEADKEYES